jgi:formamidopyrimidine-DNA glycosylase
VECIERKLLHKRLTEVRLATPFLLRSVLPLIEDAHGRRLEGMRLIGKRLIFSLNDDRLFILHFMTSIQLRWRPAAAKISGKTGIAFFDFGDVGTLLLTEASKKKRASLHWVDSTAALEQFERGGISPIKSTARQFGRCLVRENRTLKRALTDPRNFSGIGQRLLRRGPPSSATRPDPANPKSPRGRSLRAPHRHHRCGS